MPHVVASRSGASPAGGAQDEAPRAPSASAIDATQHAAHAPKTIHHVASAHLICDEWTPQKKCDRRKAARRASVDTLPDDLRRHIFSLVDREHLAPLLWTCRAWRADAVQELRRRLWAPLHVQLHASMLSVPPSPARDHVLLRYACFLYAPYARAPCYRCAACLRPCARLGECRVCLDPPPPPPRVAPRFPFRRAFLGPALAVFATSLSILLLRRHGALHAGA